MGFRGYLFLAVAAMIGTCALAGCKSDVDPADDGSKPAAPVDPAKLKPPADLPPAMKGPKGKS